MPLPQFRSLVQSKHSFLYLLPIFFVVHNFTFYYDMVNIVTALIVLTISLVVAYLLVKLSKVLLKDRYKAHLFAFSVLFANFFFGSMYEGFNSISKRSFYSKYSFQFFLLGLIIAVIFILLKRKKNVSIQIGYAFNFIFICLILFETFTLTKKLLAPNIFSSQVNFTPLTKCEDCKKPDVHLIITDGYAGPLELNDIFGFDNSGFKKSLQDRGFHYITNTSSNYNYTALSVASILNMSFLNLNVTDEKKNISGSLRAIRRNQIVHFMKDNGYEIVNNSIFRIDQSETKQSILFPPSSALLLGSTFLFHLTKIIEFRLYGNKNLVVINDGQLTTLRKTNDVNYLKTVLLTKQPPAKPRFVYTHLLMPHFPYFFDKNGKETPPETILHENRFSKKDYVEYLQYTSTRLLSLIDSIKMNSTAPPVILLLSDHGFREFEKEIEPKYYFSNISAVLMPGGDYSRFYDGMTSVNLFRALLNTQFKQQLPMLKDSSSFLRYKY